MLAYDLVRLTETYTLLRLPMPKWCSATVAAKHVWTAGLFTLTIETDGVKPFEPGQFLHLAMGDESNRINRPYSVASPYGRHLQFFIVVVEDGQLTPRLWRLEVGDQLEVSERAAGSFTLKKAPDAEILWMIATGTGLAPYIAMLRSECAWSRYQKIAVVHGARLAADLAYTQELRHLESRFPDRFKLLQALTREQQDNVLQGRIPNLLQAGMLERTTGWEMTAENSAVLLCGNPDMLNEMEAQLGQRKMKKHRTKEPGHIVVERYW